MQDPRAISVVIDHENPSVGPQGASAVSRIKATWLTIAPANMHTDGKRAPGMRAGGPLTVKRYGSRDFRERP
ncbi:hypothetical protein, partial [Komagataeibacter intermedius]|uniref:hypothetical protein n=1 Tax=Komagataeibacter intermedius TaxID=66229 RepID=UPI001AE0B84D